MFVCAVCTLAARYKLTSSWDRELVSNFFALEMKLCFDSFSLRRLLSDKTFHDPKEDTEVDDTDAGSFSSPHHAFDTSVVDLSDHIHPCCGWK
eukprot:763730-Hanusia_phi.AAC.9